MKQLYWILSDCTENVLKRAKIKQKYSNQHLVGQAPEAEGRLKYTTSVYKNKKIRFTHHNGSQNRFKFTKNFCKYLTILAIFEENAMLGLKEKLIETKYERRNFLHPPAFQKI